MAKKERHVEGWQGVVNCDKHPHLRPRPPSPLASGIFNPPVLHPGAPQEAPSVFLFMAQSPLKVPLGAAGMQYTNDIPTTPGGFSKMSY